MSREVAIVGLLVCLILVVAMEVALILWAIGVIE